MNNWRYTWYSPDDYLPRYVGDSQIVGSTGDGIAVWYIGSAHHDPSDLNNQKGSGDRTGVTLVHWSGFDMEPHDRLTTTLWAVRQSVGIELEGTEKAGQLDSRRTDCSPQRRRKVLGTRPTW